MNNDSGASLMLVKYPSFDQVLDTTCRRLWDTKLRYSLKRIGEFDRRLAAMEAELDVFLRGADNAMV